MPLFTIGTGELFAKARSTLSGKKNFAEPE